MYKQFNSLVVIYFPTYIFIYETYFLRIVYESENKY